MAKIHQTFVCQSCGAVYNRWRGRCEACDGWNTILEETAGGPGQSGPPPPGRRAPVVGSFP